MNISDQLPAEVRDYIARLERETQALESKNQALSQLAVDSQLTTLNIFLKNCHVHLSLPLRVRHRDGPISLKTTVTSPKGRNCPKRLKKWKGFDDAQQKLFDRISAVYHPVSETASKLFPETLFVRRLGDIVENHEVTSEDDLRVHERTNMENMVQNIVKDIVNREEELAEQFDLGQGVTFQNHTNDLAPGDKEGQGISSNLEASDPMPKPTNVDQIGVVKRGRGGDTVSFLIEYKSPYKLPKEVLREGLRDGMDLEQEIINRAKYATDPEQKMRQCAEDAVAAVITQLYSYMLKAGIEYGYLSTGEIYIFLHIRFQEPDSVYYHLAEPNIDVNLDEHGNGALVYSAISQVLCFCLRASHSSRRNQQWRRDAKAKSIVWEVNTDLVLAQMTPLKSKIEAPSSEYKDAKTHELRPGESSDRKESLRQPRFTASRVNCIDDPVQDRQDPESSSDEQDAHPESPSARARPTGSKTPSATKNAQAGGNNVNIGHQHLPYCTHECLRGLSQRGRLDFKCPNRALHPSTKGLRHTIDTPTLCTLLRNQLDTDMDNNCTPLDIQGARGALFKLTLASHGYTLVGKGTVRAFIPDLRHEGRVYQKLCKLQGTCIPVYLGNFDCIYPYEYDIDVEIIHFLLLSWGGKALSWPEFFACAAEIGGLEDRLRALGVEHQDERCLNVLWDDRREQLMLIDFERATFIRAPTARARKGTAGTRLPLGEVSSNVPKKRCWEVDATGDVIGLKFHGQPSGNELYHSLSI